MCIRDRIAAQRYTDELGIVNVKDGRSMSGPIEMWCGGRGMAKLFGEDFFDRPEKVERVFKIIHEFTMAKYEALFKSEDKPLGLWVEMCIRDRYEAEFKSENKPLGLWVAAWRGIPSLMNREMFLKYAWKYFVEYVQLLSLIHI